MRVGGIYQSVVCVLDDPTSESEFAIHSDHTVSEPSLPQLVVHEDAGIEGEAWDAEVWEWDLSGTEGNVEWGDVAENGDQAGFEEETEVTEVVHHTLLGEREVSGLADHQVGPLDAHDGAEVSGLSELEGFSGVADWVTIRDVGLSVESWVVSVSWWPSASSEVVGITFGGVEQSDVDLVHSSLVPSQSDPLVFWQSHVGVSVLAVADWGDSILSKDGGVGGLGSIVLVSDLWKWSLELRHEPEGLWSDTEVVEDDEVGVHTGRGLDDSDLEVGEGDQLGVHEVIKLGLSWSTVHDIQLGVLVGEGDGWYHIGSQVNAQDEHS